MSSVEQCQKLVDKIGLTKPYTLIAPKAIDVLSRDEVTAKIDSNIFSSETLDDTIKKAKNVLLILHHVEVNAIMREVLSSLLMKLSKVDFSMIIAKDGNYCATVGDYKIMLGEELYLHYSSRIVLYNPDDIEDFDFFGTTKRRTPIFLHKSYLRHDTIITLSCVTYDSVIGYNGGKALIFPGIASRKSGLCLVPLMLDLDKRRKEENVRVATTTDNPLFSDSTEAVMIARSKNNWFGINLIPNENGEIIDVTSGDLFLSHIEAIKIIDKHYSYQMANMFDGLILISQAETIFEMVTELEIAARALQKGCRLVVLAEDIERFGSDNFRNIFYNANIESMFDDLLEHPRYSKIVALTLKHLSQDYHIAVLSKAYENDIRQAGLNTIKLKDIAEFLQNSNKIGILTNVSRFAAI